MNLDQNIKDISLPCFSELEEITFSDVIPTYTGLSSIVKEGIALMSKLDRKKKYNSQCLLTKEGSLYKVIYRKLGESKYRTKLPVGPTLLLRDWHVVTGRERTRYFEFDPSKHTWNTILKQVAEWYKLPVNYFDGNSFNVVLGAHLLSHTYYKDDLYVRLVKEPGHNRYNLPGGKPTFDREPILETLERELTEEKLSVPGWRYRDKFYIIPQYVDNTW